MARPTVHTLTQTRGEWKCARCGGSSYASNRGQADAFMGACVSQNSTGGQRAVIIETVADRHVQEGIERSQQAEMVTPRQAELLGRLIREGRTGRGSQSSYSIGLDDIPTLSKRMASAIISDALES